MRNQAPMVSPIQEVTEPNTATATPLTSVTPTSEMTCITPTNDEPGDEDYGDGYGSDEPGNDLVDSFSEDVPSLKSQSQSGMPTESTIFFQEAEMKIEQEIQKEEEDAFEAEERRIAAEIQAGKTLVDNITSKIHISFFFEYSVDHGGIVFEPKSGIHGSKLVGRSPRTGKLGNSGPNRNRNEKL